MSQHDYNLANAAGATFRADANSALSAILSQNSGAAAPSTTTAFMLWYDTTIGVLKQRNAANTDWVTLWSLNSGTGKPDWPLASATYAGAVELATTAEAQAGTDTLRAVTPAGVAATALVQGKHMIYIPASAMRPRTTNGAEDAEVELATNKIMLHSLNFDTTTQEFAQFAIEMPKSWNEGTFTFIPEWYYSAGTGNVVWALQAVAVGDGNALDVAFGAEQTSSDVGQGTGTKHQGPESAAITATGSPADQERVLFQIKRNVSDGGDTLTDDAKLLGIRLFLTYNAKDDS